MRSAILAVLAIWMAVLPDTTNAFVPHGCSLRRSIAGHQSSCSRMGHTPLSMNVPGKSEALAKIPRQDRGALSKTGVFLAGKAFVYLLLVHMSLGLMRAASASAEGPSFTPAQEPAERLLRSTDSATFLPTTRHGHRLAFVGSDLSEARLKREDGVAFVSAEGKEWKGVFGIEPVEKARLKLNKWLNTGFKDFVEWVQFNFQEMLCTDMKFVALGTFAVALTLVGGLILKIVSGEEDWTAAMYKAYALLNNVPGVDAFDTEEEKKSVAFVANGLFFAGVLTFALLLGLITSTAESQLETALSGNHKVIARQHVLMLNWNEKSPKMLKQLDSAINDGAMSASTPVVVLAQKDKEEMDSLVDEALGDSSKLQVHTRSGNPAVFSDLEHVSAGHAKHILLLASEAEDEDSSCTPGERVLVQTAALQSLEADKQPGTKLGQTPNDIKMVVAGFGSDALEEQALPGISIMPRGDFSERLVAAVSAQAGLGPVYSEIFNQGVGCELYLYAPEKAPWLLGVPYKQLSSHFPDSVVLGWTNGEKLFLNPPPDSTLPAGAGQRVNVVLLTKNKNVKCTRQANTYTTAEGVSWKPDKMKTKKLGSFRTPQRVLLLGEEDPDSVLVRELVNYLAPGSEIVSFHDKAFEKTSQCVTVRRISGSSLRLESIAASSPHRANVLLVRSGAEATLTEQERDARVLAKTRLALLARQQHTTLTPLRIVAQVQSEETSERLQLLVDELGDESVTLECIDTSDVFAGATVQVLWQPELKNVFMDLMDTSGAEITMLPANFFGPPGRKLSFGDVANVAAQHYNAVALGVSGADVAAQHYNAVALGVSGADGSVLSPPQSQMLTLDSGDFVICFVDSTQAGAD